MTVEQEIMKRLTAALSPVTLRVINESQKHAGHAGVAGDTSGETHFVIEVVSAAFAGLSRVQCHQKIYGVVGELMDNPIHALSIDARVG